MDIAQQHHFITRAKKNLEAYIMSIRYVDDCINLLANANKDMIELQKILDKINYQLQP